MVSRAGGGEAHGPPGAVMAPGPPYIRRIRPLTVKPDRIHLLYGLTWQGLNNRTKSARIRVLRRGLDLVSHLTHMTRHAKRGVAGYPALAAAGHGVPRHPARSRGQDLPGRRARHPAGRGGHESRVAALGRRPSRAREWRTPCPGFRCPPVARAAWAAGRDFARATRRGAGAIRRSVTTALLRIESRAGSDVPPCAQRPNRDVRGCADTGTRRREHDSPGPLPARQRHVSCIIFIMHQTSGLPSVAGAV
jgi:hypothetical protein